MPKIPEIIVNNIIDTARIEEVVADFVHLRKVGVRYTGLCPFHDDNHDGNFMVYPRDNIFKCFACEAKGGSVEFLMKHCHMTFPDAIRYLGKKYCIETDDNNPNFTPPPPRPARPPKPMLTLPMSFVTSREKYNTDNLVRWIATGINWDAAQRSRIPEMLKAYHIGHGKSQSESKWRPYNITSNDFTIFWEIDDQHRVRTGKMMMYHPDGHRVKEKHATTWIHSTLAKPRIKRDKWGNAITEVVTDDDGRQHEEPVLEQPFRHIYDEEKQRIEHCLFGLHLLDAYGYHADVNIVESEKTALLMSIAYGNNPMQVWMACGGESNLTRERLMPIILRRRRINLYPDRDGIEKWQAKANDIGYTLMSVVTTPVTKWWSEEDGQKADIADVVIRHLNSNSHIKSVGEEPEVRELIEKLDLERVNK